MKYAEVSSGNIIRMEPRARGTNYGPTGHTTGLEETREARRAQNERFARFHLFCFLHSIGCMLLLTFRCTHPWQARLVYSVL